MYAFSIDSNVGVSGRESVAGVAAAFLDLIAVRWMKSRVVKIPLDTYTPAMFSATTLPTSVAFHEAIFDGP